MEIERTSLWREVDRILTSGSSPVHFSLAANINIVATNEKIQALKVIQRDESRDYEQNVTDATIIRLLILAGDYANVIYPHQDRLEITVIRYPLAETGDAGNPTASVRTERYIATLLDQGSPNVEMPGQNAMDRETMNRLPPLEIEFQLLSKAYAKLRTVMVGATHRQTTAGDVVLKELTSKSKALDIDAQLAIRGVDMVPSQNTAVREHVIIPQRVRLTDLPAYIHEHQGGLYSMGLGYYLQNDYWYVYPCYDVQRWNQAEKTLTIINVPNDRLVEVERTYRQNGKNLIVLATDAAHYRDSSGVDQVNNGNGMRFMDASKFMAGFTKQEGNKAIASRVEVANEFISLPRDDGQNLAPVSDNPITANSLFEFSKLAKRQGGLFTAVWSNSNPDLLLPGMPVKIRYVSGVDIREMDGVLLRCHHFTYMDGVGLTTARHKSATTLSIYVKGDRA